MNNKKPLVLIAVAALVVIIAGVSALLWVGKGPEMTRALADCKGMETIVNENGRTAGDLAYLRQEVAACKGEDPDKDTKPANEGATPSSSTSASSSASSTAVATSESQAPQSRTWEYLANRAPIEKDGVNAFGPKIAISEGLAGQDMEGLNRDEAWKELFTRHYVDPMLTAVHESDLGLADGSDVDARTARYASDHAAWDEANKRISDKLARAKSVEVVQLAAGVYDTNFSIPGDPPSVRRDGAFHRPEAFNVLKVTLDDGGVVQWRLFCGFQNFSREELTQYAPMPEPTPPMGRGPNGTPTPPTGGGPGTSTPGTSTPPETTTTPPVTTTTPPVTTTTPPVTTTTPPPVTTTNTPKDPSEGSEGGGGGGVGEGDPGPETTLEPVVPTYTAPVVTPPAGPPAGSTPDPTTGTPPPAEVDNGDDGSSGDPGGF